MDSGAIDTTAARRAGWIAFLTTGTIVGSFIFACATPFPALAALAALHMSRRDAVILVAVSWAANQAIGYGFLHYPQTWDSVAWGAVIGISALAATAAAAGTEALARGMARAGTAAVVFAAAMVAFEATLYAATAFLPSDSGVFGPQVMFYVLTVNAVAFLILLACQGLARAAGIAIGAAPALPVPR